MERLRLYIEHCKKKDFDPEKWNCAIFTNECVKAYSGVDVIEGVPLEKRLDGFKNWQTQEVNLLKVMREATHGIMKKTRSPYKTGDVVVCRTPDNQKAIGVIYDRHIFMPHKKQGVISFPYKNRVIMAWRLNDRV